MRWLLITRKLDPADDLVGFVMRWVEQLAARLDHLDVLCQEHAGPPLPANVSVYSLGKESGAGRAAQAWHFTDHLRRLVPRNNGVLCHMIPRYVLFAAPWARLHRRPLLFWYTHRQITPELRLAARLATHILTAAPGSFPLPTPRLHVMGHGIETELFPLAESEGPPPAILHVARLSHIKGQDRLLRAASQIAARADAEPFQVVLAGGPVPHEPEFPAVLQNLVAQLDPPPPATFTGPLARPALAEVVAQSAIAVNLSPPGLFDKAALETMLAGKPTLVTNPDFAPLLGEAVDLLLLPYAADDAALTERLAALLALGAEQRAAIGRALRARVLAEHSLERLMDRVAALMAEAARG